MDERPFTVGEFIDCLSEYERGDELRFMGEHDELFFFRFKRRGKTLLTIEFREPESMGIIEGSANP